MPVRDFGDQDETPTVSKNLYGLPGVQADPVPVLLDWNDPFDRALIPIVQVSHRKRADYATDGKPFDNFRITAEWAGFEADWLAALFNVAQKMARIQALRANGRADDPANEAMYDTVLDLATYSILALAMYEQHRADTTGVVLKNGDEGVSP
jgi:hypothetical protein